MNTIDSGCPLCGQPLSEVGRKGRKLKCDTCRSVFDADQLNRYRSSAEPATPANLPHAYETPHMHQVEAARALAKEKARPPRNPFGGIPVSNGGKPAAPVSGGGINKTVVKALLIVFALMFALPVLMTCTVAMLSYSDSEEFDDIVDSLNSDIETSETTGPADIEDYSFAASVEGYADAPLHGRCAVLALTWENPNSWKSSFAGIYDFTFETGNGRFLDVAYPADGDGGYDDSSRFDLIRPLQKSKVTLAYPLEDMEDVNLLTVSEALAEPGEDGTRFWLVVKDGESVSIREASSTDLNNFRSRADEADGNRGQHPID